MVLTTHPASSTRALSPARCAAMAAASPQGPAPTTNRSMTGASESNDLVPPGADAHIGDRRLDERFDAIEIPTRGAGQVRERPGGRGRAFPALEPLVARNRALECHEIARELLVQLAIDLIPDAELKRVQRVEYVELCHREIGEAVDSRGVSHDDGVEPAAAARAARGRAELVAEAADFSLERLAEFRWQRPIADACRVRFHHAKYPVHEVGTNADADGRTAGRRAARRHVRIRALTDVPHPAPWRPPGHRCLRLHRTIDGEADVVRERHQSFGELLELRHDGVHVDRRIGPITLEAPLCMLGAL